MPPGVGLTLLATHSDERGDLTEIFRDEWHNSPAPVQWIVTRSETNVLRGVHVHRVLWDYLCVVAGEIFVGLHDLKAADPTARRSALVRLTGDRLQMLTIPPGVAHGFYSSGDSMYITGASAYYDPSDHRACRWDSPELALRWPCTAPRLSASDRDAGGYAELRAAFLGAAGVRS